MLERRTYDGMKGFADGFFSCFRQFKDYIEKDPETAIEKMQNIVDIIESVTQTETQNSNLTFEKDECAKEYEELGLKELKELIKADRKTEPQTDCAWK